MTVLGMVASVKMDGGYLEKTAHQSAHDHIFAITGQQDVDANIVEQAINNRSGMPVRLN